MEAVLRNLIEGYRDELIADARSILRLPSVCGSPCAGAPFGREINEALEAVLALGRKMGFSCRSLQGYAGVVDYACEGAHGEPLGILTHIDVVPAGEGWSRPPFGALLQDGRIYARGAVDDKGPLVAVLYAMRALKESGLPLARPVRHIIGCDEESGFRCMEYYLKHEDPPPFGFVPDTEFPLVFAEKGICQFRVCRTLTCSTEKGAIELLSLRGGGAVNVVPAEAAAHLRVTPPGQKLLQQAYAAFAKRERLSLLAEGETVELRAGGKAAHASMPESGENAVALLLEFLKGLSLLPAETVLFLKSLHELFGGESGGRGAGIAVSDGESGPLTLSLNVIEVDEGFAEAKLDMRYPVTAEFAPLWRRLTEVCAARGLEIHPMQHKEPLFLPQGSPLARTLLQVYRDVTGDDSPPLAIGGGTYSRAMKNFAAFGPLLPGREKLAHQADEYIATEDLMLMTMIYAEAIYRLAGAGNETDSFAGHGP
ncbi:MAG: dipeptidase PepV [Clostridiales bacterium]|nr:dipeptidase PepV [Clostridiales bacterium]